MWAELLQPPALVRARPPLSRRRRAQAQVPGVMLQAMAQQRAQRAAPVQVVVGRGP